MINFLPRYFFIYLFSQIFFFSRILNFRDLTKYKGEKKEGKKKQYKKKDKPLFLLFGHFNAI